MIDHDDPFAPPAEPVEVKCMHCERVYTSDRMRFDELWLCAFGDCDGRGFGFDILPTDKEQ